MQNLQLKVSNYCFKVLIIIIIIIFCRFTFLGTQLLLYKDSHKWFSCIYKSNDIVKLIFKASSGNLFGRYVV